MPKTKSTDITEHKYFKIGLGVAVVVLLLVVYSVFKPRPNPVKTAQSNILAETMTINYQDENGEDQTREITVEDAFKGLLNGGGVTLQSAQIISQQLIELDTRVTELKGQITELKGQIETLKVE